MKLQKENNQLGLKLLLKKNRRRQKYNERRAKILLIRYKKLNSIKARNELVEMCFPIIFTLLKKQIKRITVRSTTIDNEDLFNECIVTTIKCIDGYNLDNIKKAKFITYLWHSLNRKLLRFVNNNVLKYDNYQTNIDDYINDNSYDNDFFDDMVVENLFNNKQKQVIDKFSDEEEFENLKKDFYVMLNEQEIKLIEYRNANMKVKDVCKKMKIKTNKYYKILENIKTKLEGYLKC